MYVHVQLGQDFYMKNFISQLVRALLVTDQNRLVHIHVYVHIHECVLCMCMDTNT
jgi:hypothetical protein